ncbi:MAG: hypothetical protein QF911_03540 [Candidatus Thalassarchaeaceae archaeon]|jgi:hypothetical protein|nr:hypothetical protein [Candidatus Thalassarchaeaceae archaeon]
MDDALDALDSDSGDKENQLPPLPPGLMMPPPGFDLPPPAPPDPEFDLPPPQPPPHFAFPSDLTGDGDLLDAANSLSNSPNASEPSGASDFKSVWERRKASASSAGEVSKGDIYRRIDDISTRSSDTLIDRFSDRFGSEIDREIIVLRKKDQQNLRSIKPTVELISTPDESTGMTFSEFIDAMDDQEFVVKVSEATGISSETLNDLDINALKSFFESADSDHSGTLDFEEFVVAIQSFRSSDEEFAHFFSVVNNLLGELPDDKAREFMESDSFELFREVGDNPNSVVRPKRSEFFIMVNELLVDLPDTVMQNFISSPDFEMYKKIAERYGDS